MPIQFQCPSCSHVLNLPDTAAGKQGKCPKCAGVVTVPAAGVAAPSNPRDDEFWSELDAKKEAVQQDTGHGHAVKRSDAQILKGVLGKADEAKVIKRVGTPWERTKEGGMFDRYWDTAIGVMNNATETFAEMKLQGGIGKPFFFLMLGALFGSLIMAVYGAIGNVISLVSAAEAANAAAAEGEASGGVVLTVMGGILLAALFLGTFLGGALAGIVHTFLQALGLQLALPMVGVKDATFEKNFRVSAYTNGSIYLCNIVPGLGLGFMLFLWFNGMIKGLESVYAIPPNKAVLTVLLLFVPLVLPIVAVVGFVMLTALGYIG